MNRFTRPMSRFLLRRSKSSHRLRSLSNPPLPPEPVKKFKSPSVPLFQRGKYARKKQWNLPFRYLGLFLFRLEFPSLAKRGQGRFSGACNRSHHFFHSFPFFKGGKFPIGLKGRFCADWRENSAANFLERTLVLVLLGLSLAGCGSFSPRPDPSRFFTLTAIAQPAAPAAKESSNAGGISLGIGPIRLPGYLDRQEIVTRVSPNRMDLSEYDRWAEPLETNFNRVLAQNLAVLLNTDQLVSYPWEMNRRPAYQVEVEVLHFETNVGGDVEMSARWTVLDPNKKIRLKSGETVLTRQPAAKSTDASVAALSETLGDLSRAIANAISAIEGQK